MHLCVTYPNLSKSDYSLLSEFRKKHDLTYVDVIDLHWTMIFPSSCEGFSIEFLTEHISRVASKFQPIDFTCRYALVYDDDSSDDYYIFLVPDEGFSQISRLHDELYTGELRASLRLDIPFIPHIGIATHKDKDYLYELAQEWNNQQHEIHGSVESLTICSYDGEAVTDLKHLKID